jgi:hypothetical protein
MNLGRLERSASSLAFVLVLLAIGCSSSSGGHPPADAAAPPTGGTVPEVTGGYLGSGGVVATGGIVGSGGLAATGGTVATGGVIITGGHVGSGGTLSTGGTVAGGGTVSTGGTNQTGGTGAVGTGGHQSTGGAATGGTFTTGGMTASGGTVASGGKVGSGGIVGTGGNTGSGGAKMDAASTAGCQCTVNDESMSIPWNCYCAAYGLDCELSYASFRAEGTPPWYSGISEYAGCNLAVVYRSDPLEMSYRYFDLTTGQLIGLLRTMNGGVTCPFALDAGATVFSLGSGNTAIPTDCVRSACYAGSNEPRYCGS